MSETELQGRAPIRMRRVENAQRVRHPGDFYWHEAARGDRYLRVALPGRTQRYSVRGFKVGGRESWSWDGDEDRPTLKEPVDAPYWHGHVRRGFLVQA